MPGVYSKDKFDLAVLAGIVSKKNILDKNNVKNKNIILAIPQTGYIQMVSPVRTILNKIKLAQN